MSLRVISQSVGKRNIWKQIGSSQNINAQQTIKRKESKSKFGTSQPKSPQSGIKKHLKFPNQYSHHSFIKQMSRDQGYQEQAKSETGLNNELNSFIHDAHQQKHQPQKKPGKHSRAVSSSMIHMVPNNRVSQNNGTVENYQALIANLQKQFTTFQKQIFNQLKDLEHYYAKMINKLEARYMEEVDRLKMELSLASQHNVSQINQTKNLIIQQNPEKIQRKIISRKKPTQLKGLTSPKQLKSGSNKQISSSLSDLATGIQKQQFKKFAQTFQRMKQEMNEQIPSNLVFKQVRSDQIKLKI